MNCEHHLSTMVITVYNIIERILSRIHHGIHFRLYQIKSRKRNNKYFTYFRLITTYFRYNTKCPSKIRKLTILYHNLYGV